MAVEERRSELMRQKRAAKYRQKQTNSQFEVLDMSSKLVPTDAYGSILKLRTGLSSAR